MIKLRDYQLIAVNNVRSALIKYPRNSVICEMPTGGGKTVVFSYIVGGAERKGKNTLILTDRTELLHGTGGTLKEFGIHPKYITAGRKFPPDGKTFVAMTQTLKNRIHRPEWQEWFKSLSLIIIDEIHKQEFNRFFQENLFKNKTVIGFSATPKRGGKQRQLGEDFDKIIHTMSVVELIDKGFLMPDLYYGFSDKSPDMKGVQKNSRGDYLENAMFKRFDNPKTYGGAIEAYKSHTPGSIALVFCSNIIHSVRTCKKFNDAGIKAKFLVSNMSKPNRPKGYEPDKKEATPEWVKYWEKKRYYDEYNLALSEFSGERATLIKQWKNGEFKVMVNAGILTTGFDFPAIETIILMRATISEVLYLQMLGRGSRPFSGKTHFNILDFGKNAERLGGYKLPRKWHLYHESRAGSGIPAVKECGSAGKDKNGKRGCGDYILVSAKICPNCGYIYPEKKEEKAVDLELMVSDSAGQVKRVKPIGQMNYQELDSFAKTSNFKQMWVIVQIYLRNGEQGLEDYRKFKGYKHSWKTKIFSHIPAKVIAERIEKEKKTA